MIATLEYWLVKNGIYRSSLETGIYQQAALKFYEKIGYQSNSPFGSYKDDPLSVFKSKSLSSAELSMKAGQDPFYVVTFSSQLIEPSVKYQAVGDEMARLVREQHGFIGMNSIRNEDGSGFTASYWQNLEAISSWGQNFRHLEAQRLGRTEFYKKFRTFFARVEALFATSIQTIDPYVERIQRSLRN